MSPPARISSASLNRSSTAREVSLADGAASRQLPVDAVRVHYAVLATNAGIVITIPTEAQDDVGV